MIKLSDIIKKTASTVWVDYQFGIRFQLNFLSRSRVLDISARSTIYKYDDNPAVKQRVPTIDPKLVAQNLAASAIVGWEGVTPESLSNLVDIDLTGLTDEQKKEQIPFDVETFAMLLTQAFDLDTWIQSRCTDITLFKPGSADAAKNSSTSQSGNSTPSTSPAKSV